MKDELFSLVQECTNKYSVDDLSATEVEIRIRIPKKFRTLWLSKLSSLNTTLKEIDEYAEEQQQNL